MKSFDEIMLSEEFMAFMNENNNKNATFWKNFLKDNPELEYEFTKAKLIHEALTIHKKHNITDEQKNKDANLLLYRINAYEKTKLRNVRLLSQSWLRIAAVIIFIVCISIPAALYVLEAGQNITYNEITVPSGEKSTIRLSDGTVIWLNSESKLKYPSKFKAGSREVKLEGEGYFDGAKKKGSRFTVITQDIKVVALGTIFDIKSYPADKIIETTLVEGEIKFQQLGGKKKFSDIVLKPNQKVIYRKAERVAEVQSSGEDENNDINIAENKEIELETEELISINHVNTNNIISWKDHLLVFDNETLEEIAVKMSRWYKMEVSIIDEELKDHRFTGKFVNNETYFQVLEAIDLTTPITYEIDKNQVYIKRKNYIP